MTDHQTPDWSPQPRTPRWARAVAVLIVLAGIVSALVIYTSRNDDGPATVSTLADRSTVHPSHHRHHHEVATRERQLEEKTLSPPIEPATRMPRPPQDAGHDTILGAGANASFDSLAASLPAQVGLAVAPVSGGTVREFGDLREGHAWSSIKVPILTTLVAEQGESLDSEEQALASSAVTASDNEAAAALFSRIEAAQGGLEGASRAVESTLRRALDETTVVATAPPPPGAVSTYGQTEWSLRGSIQFYASLADGCLLGPTGTGYVTGLMEEVIPEQRWGLGEAGFPSGWSVGMKGGWGPEVEAGGAYLVRQSGFVRDGARAIAVAMIALDESGTYPAGASDLTRIAQWLASELQGLGPARPGC